MIPLLQGQEVVRVKAVEECLPYGNERKQQWDRAQDLVGGEGEEVGPHLRTHISKGVILG